MGESPQPMTASALPVAGARPRLDSIDALHSLVMVLMALDHTRDFLSQTPWAATNFPTTTVPLFMTRWITHYCAPDLHLPDRRWRFLSLGQRPIPGGASRGSSSAADCGLRFWN